VCVYLTRPHPYIDCNTPRNWHSTNCLHDKHVGSHEKTGSEIEKLKKDFEKAREELEEAERNEIQLENG
jgi:hypothetical protein